MTGSATSQLAPNRLTYEAVVKCEDGILASDTNIVAISETIVWYPISPTRMPDSDITVLLFDESSDEPVWPGYFDGEQWIYVDGNIAHPTHWADMAIGPKMQADAIIRGT